MKHAGGRAWSVAPFTLVLALAVSSGACSFTFGFRPPLENLNRLTRGTSTEEEVRKTLGAPRGTGGAHLPVGTAKVLLYDAGGREGGEMRNRVLLVFIRDGHYDGYLWYDATIPIKERQ